ncbi:hypothetical protein PYW08_010629 [Mythimna loreyi]|uniref:Uncharacterized protein n=1 Tax=Mythimna loreyi TaxID=667449 RepID=A0ACC2Q3L9_9NEOP|nr:hypothetical protein PYW08_010629 [Mythimna loreyi]
MSEPTDVRPSPIDFDKFLPWVCLDYHVDADIVINRVVQQTYVNVADSVPRKKLSKKYSLRPRVAKAELLIQSYSNSATEESVSQEKLEINKENKVTIETIYNNDDDLVALKFLKNKMIPRKVMQIIALTLPYQKHLTSITINGGLRMETLYEISQFLPNSQITELCFDGTFLDKANYHILLTQNNLKHLSLARCTINDDVVKLITDHLIDPFPAAKILSALNLSNNKITDIGAKYIADMLRRNRQLCYLSLAGNMITDEGGVSILNILQKFPMQTSEALEGRTNYVAYLKKRSNLIHTLIKELEAAAYDSSNKRKSIKKGMKYESQSMQNMGSKKPITELGVEAQIIKEKAEVLADAKLGLFNEPFSPNNTTIQDGVVYCLGNNTLSCLNFAYNNLTYTSLKKLHEVLLTQKVLDRIPRGLIKIIIEGNLMPVSCEEYEDINCLLQLGLESLIKYEASLKKKPLGSKSTTKLPHSIK